MAKKRASLNHAETHTALERSFERKARGFAFEAGIAIHTRGAEVFLEQEGQAELLCVVDDSSRFWRIVWRSMCEQFPALSRYVH